MNPRSPPARPHIGLHFSRFSSTADWGEDDAWDSTSDSESPRQSTLNSSWNRSAASSTVTAPKAVPRTSSSSSSSNLAFSYTHLQAPSSYPPKDSIPSEAPKNGWTIVRTSHSRNSSQNKLEQESERKGAGLDRYSTENGDIDVEGDMILGDLEPEASEPDMDSSNKPLPNNSKQKHNVGSIRADIEEIVTGEHTKHLNSKYIVHDFPNI